MIRNLAGGPLRSTARTARLALAACSAALAATLASCASPGGAAGMAGTLGTHGTAPAPSVAVQGFDAYWGPYGAGSAEPADPVDSLKEAKERADLIVVGRVASRSLNTSGLAGGTVDTLTVNVSRTLKGPAGPTITVDLARLGAAGVSDADAPDSDTLWILSRGDRDGNYVLLGGNTAAGTDERGVVRQIEQATTPDTWFPDDMRTLGDLESAVKSA